MIDRIWQWCGGRECLQYMCARLQRDRIASRGHLSYTVRLMMCGEGGPDSIVEVIRGQVDDLSAAGPWVQGERLWLTNTSNHVN